MRAIISRHIAFNLGEVDPLIMPRDDNEGTKAACSLLKNYVPLVQGSIERREGLLHVDFVRRKIQSLAIEQSMISAPNGGTIANLFTEGSKFVTATQIGTTDPYVILAWDFGAPRAIDIVDLIDFSLTSDPNGSEDNTSGGGGGGGGTDWGNGGEDPWLWDNQFVSETAAPFFDNACLYGVNCAGEPPELFGKLKCQYFEGGVWKDFGFALSIGIVNRSRRFSSAPNYPKTAQLWRIVIAQTNQGGPRYVQVKGVRAFAETNENSEFKKKRFTISADTGAFVMVITEGNAEFYRKGIRCGSAAYEITSEFVREIDVTQSMDTIIVLHRNFETLSIQRQGTIYDWDFRPTVFEHIPKYDFDGTNVGGVNEVQQLRFANYVNGDVFNLTVEDFTTGSIIWQGNATATAASVKSALEALGNIGVGNVEVVQGVDANSLDITFVKDAGNVDWPEMVPKTIKSNIGGIVCTSLTQGDEGGTPKFEAARGYCGTAAFYAQRLFLGNLKSLPETFLGSKPGDYFNLRTKGNRENSAIDLTIDTDEVTQIRRIVASRALMVFTSSAEFFWSNEPIRADAPGIKNFTRHGISPFMAPIEIDGALMFVPKTNADILQIVWDDQLQTYATQSISTLSAHLVNSLNDIGFRKRANHSRPDMIVCTKDDGTAVGLSMMRSENMTACFRIETQGEFKGVCGDDAETLYIGVKRFGRYRIERFGECALDAAVRKYAENGPINVIDGLWHLEGVEIALLIDGEEIGLFVVINGQIQLPKPAIEWVEAGLRYDAEIKLIPFPREGSRAGRVGRRISAFAVEIEGSTFVREFEIKGSGEKWWTLPTRAIDQFQLDKLAREEVKIGWLGRLEGIPGYDQYGAMSIRCKEQARHTINSIVVKATI